MSCDYDPEGELPRAGREGLGARVAAAAAAGAAGLEPHPAAAVGPGLPAGAVPRRLPLRVPRVSILITVPVLYGNVLVKDLCRDRIGRRYFVEFSK